MLVLLIYSKLKGKDLFSFYCSKCLIQCHHSWRVCPVGKMRRLLFFHLSHWVVLSKRKGRRPRCGVLLASLRASVTAHLPAEETTADIRLEGGVRGRWSPLCYYTIHPVCMFVCLTPASASRRIVRFPWQMGEEKVRRVFREALKIWSDVTPLTFTEIHSGKADIRIDFTRWEEENDSVNKADLKR